jgi:hypothetical protein
MKALTNKYSWFSSFIIALTLLVSCNERKGDNKQPENNIPDTVQSTGDTLLQAGKIRESITFILGEDKSLDNPYYSEACKYFNTCLAAKTTYLINNCRSLTEVRNYLQKHAPLNNQPWGRINLVSHGDEWLGLSVKVTPDSRRATLERLREHIDQGTFAPLSDSIIDQNSEIAVHACGIGNNTSFVETMGVVFRSTSSIPQVVAPRLFEFYSSSETKDGAIVSNNYHAKVWMVCFRKGDKPGNTVLCNLFHEKYPDVNIDWQDALTRLKPRYDGDSYCYTFDIPVNLVIEVSNRDSLPDLSVNANILSWINQQPEINHILSKIQIPADQFSWNLKKGFSRDSKGNRKVAVSVKGFCTMFCVLKPLIDQQASSRGQVKPFVPSPADTSYFCIVKGKPYNIKS